MRDEAGPDPFRLPFAQAARFYRAKGATLVPTRTYRDLAGEIHAQAFAVAGVTKADLLRDLFEATSRAIAQGGTVQAFQRDFDDLVARYGWGHTGSRAWRARVILQTNMTAAYSAGRWQAMTDPAVMESRPVWQYRIGFAIHHRPPHEALDGTVAQASDPVWSRIWPPNGFGCHCWVKALTLEAAAGLPQMTEKQKRLWEPDPGWAYNVGASWREDLAEVVARKLPDMPSPLAAALVESLAPAVRALLTKVAG